MQKVHFYGCFDGLFERNQSFLSKKMPQDSSRGHFLFTSFDTFFQNLHL
ncbi:deoxygenase [Listeria innocua FSL J1-023]|nr:deoxygenase [Listeria innocua FSL J1-023]